jgi:hypothetical protein
MTPSVFNSVLYIVSSYVAFLGSHTSYYKDTRMTIGDLSEKIYIESTTKIINVEI